VGTWRSLPSVRGWRKGLHGGVVGLMVGLQVLGTSLWVLYPLTLRTTSDATLVSMARMELDEARLPRQQVVSVVVSDPVMGLYPPIIRAAQGRSQPKSWLAMSLAPYDHVLHRTGDATLELSLTQGHFLASEMEQLFRGPAFAMRVGDQVRVNGCRVTVLEMDGLYPTRVRFEFDTSLDDPDLVLLTLRDHTLQRLRPPPVGERVTLTWQPPFAL
jgi:hypothetical protein